MADSIPNATIALLQALLLATYVYKDFPDVVSFSYLIYFCLTLG
jgi:hypothetical protein